MEISPNFVFIRPWIFIALFCFAGFLNAQDTLAKKKKPPYRKKEEIIYDGKLYRLYNNYLTFGVGPSYSTIRKGSQRTLGVDFNFHVKRNYFQAGFLTSGYQVFHTNHFSLHACYGYRYEKPKFLFAGYAGLAYYFGVEGEKGSKEQYYDGLGYYLSAQFIYKYKYDLGIGVEPFADIGIAYGSTFGREQTLFGAKIILFFSGAYVGPKKGYNPNVRSENPGL